MLQAPVLADLSLDPFALFDDGFGLTGVGVGGRHVAEAFMVSAVIAAVDEGADLGLKITGQEVILQQDAVLEGLMSALDLALCLRMHRSAADMAHAVGADLLSELFGDATGPIAEQLRFVDHPGRRASGSFEGQLQRIGDILGLLCAEDLEQRFAAGGGLSRPTFVKSFADNQLRANLRRHLGQEITAEILDLQVSREVLRAVSIARLKSDGYDRKVAMVQAGELPRSQLPSTEDVERIRVELRQATQAQFSAKARPAAVYEHAEFLDFSLRNARDYCAISSLGLSPAIFQRAVLDLLEKRLSAGLEGEHSIESQDHPGLVGGSGSEAALRGSARACVEKIRPQSN